ncbi:MAG: tetratricopeptide repeat protein, partial [bacterium]|nr:tetratricopeptide repeat protein [bacterium]
MKRWIWILMGGALMVGYTPVKAQDYVRDIESAYRRAQVDSALGFAQAFVAAHPDSVDAHGFLGTLYAESGRLDDAIASFQKIITLKPETVKGYRDLALLYTQNGKVDVAVQTLNEGLEKSAQPVILRLERAVLLRDMGNIQGA